MRSLKSVLGTPLMRENRRMFGRNIDLLDIIALFLSELKTRAEHAEQCTFEHVLSGRPVHFHSADAQKDDRALADLTLCYQHAGFKSVNFICEPEAAARANNLSKTKKHTGLIVDIGGGTSDLTVFKLDPDKPAGANNGLEIIASHGLRLGGTDFDKLVNLEFFMPLLGKDAPLRRLMGKGTLSAPKGIFSDLAFPAERAKFHTNKAEQAACNFSLRWLEKDLLAPIEKAAFDRLLQPGAEKLFPGVVEVLNKAGCRTQDVTGVIFTGGSSLMQMVPMTLQTICPAAQFHTSAVFTAVADGLAAALISGATQ